MIKEGKTIYLGVVLNFAADEQAERVVSIELKTPAPKTKLASAASEPEDSPAWSSSPP